MFVEHREIIARFNQVHPDRAETLRERIEDLGGKIVSDKPIRQPWPEIDKEAFWGEDFLDFTNRISNVIRLNETKENTQQFITLHETIGGFLIGWNKPTNRYIPFDAHFRQFVIDQMIKTRDLYAEKFPPPEKTPYAKSSVRQYTRAKQFFFSIREIRSIIDYFGLDNENGLGKSEEEISEQEGITLVTTRTNIQHSFYELYKLVEENGMVETNFPYPQQKHFQH